MDSLDDRVAAWLAKGNDQKGVKKKPAGGKIKKRPAGATSPSPASSGTTARLGRALLNWRPPPMTARGVSRSDAIGLQEHYECQLALCQEASGPAPVIVDPETDERIMQELEDALLRPANHNGDDNVDNDNDDNGNAT